MLRALWTVFRNDLALERAAFERVLTMALFGLLLGVVYHFTLFQDETVLDRAAAGGAWSVFFFAATLGLGRTFAAEKEHGAFEAFLLSPAPAEALYLGKTLGNFALVLAAEGAIWGSFALFFRFPGRHFADLALLLALGALGLSALGTLVAALTLQTRRLEMLFPVLFFPLALPVVMAGAYGWAAALAGEGTARALPFLAVCAILYLSCGVLLFEYAARE